MCRAHTAPCNFVSFFFSLSNCVPQTDARVQAISEVLNTLRITKLFAWEDKVKADMKEKREAELNMAFKKSALFIIIDCIK